MKIAVVGAGTMGAGIAQVCAHHGHDVCLRDVGYDQLDRAKKSIERSLKKILEKSGAAEPDEQLQEHMQHLKTTTEWEHVAESEWVIEAVFESFDVKKEVFQKLDAICGPEAILATNTSSIPITRLAAATRRPQQVVGMHFMNPVPLMKLVEIIQGAATEERVVERTEELARNLGKVPVRVKDFPGFISNRVLMPLLNEAMFALMEGVAETEAIDQIMKLGMNHPMGPLQLADFIGLDVCLDIMNVLYEGFKDSKYRPCPLLRQKVEAGWLGRKSGRGFYSYS